MTFRELINKAGRLVNVLASGEAFSGSELSDAKETVNGILKSWANVGLLTYINTNQFTHRSRSARRLLD